MTFADVLRSAPPGMGTVVWTMHCMTGSKAAIYDGRRVYMSRAMELLCARAHQESEEELLRMAERIPVNRLYPPACLSACLVEVK
jgi:hypothetical protein